MSRDFACAFGAATMLLGARASARADTLTRAEQADALYERAKERMEAGDASGACPLYAQSYALDPATGSLLSLALCYETIGRTASAWTLYVEATDEAQAKGEADRAEFARVRAQKLQPRVPRVTIDVAPQPGQRVPDITLDRAPLAREKWGSAIPLDPGEHELAARGEGLDPWAHRFAMQEGETASVAVPRLHDVPVLPPPSEPRQPATWTLVAWTTGGAGLLALGVGAAYGMAAIVNKAASTENGNCSASNVCNPIGASDAHRARQDEQLADVGYAIGGGLLLTAGAIWLMAHGEKPRATPPTGVTVQPTIAKGGWALAVDGRW